MAPPCNSPWVSGSEEAEVRSSHSFRGSSRREQDRGAIYTSFHKLGRGGPNGDGGSIATRRDAPSLARVFRINDARPAKSDRA